MEAHGWTWDEYLNAPWDLVVEAEIRLSKRALAEKKAREK
jgi:hypothetical protein